ncbi:MAG: lyase family protein, partial [Myxococcota bacterium]|nr:lyase family protein [Myxococcota bacterium]
MIERYTRPKLAEIWSDEGRYRRWLDVEIAVCEVRGERGEIPADAVHSIREKASFDVARIAEIEGEVRHDVIAFLTNVAEHVGPDARWVHFGMTSSDVLDTALALQIRDAGALLREGVTRVAEVLRRRALPPPPAAAAGLLGPPPPAAAAPAAGGVGGGRPGPAAGPRAAGGR